MRHRLGKKHRFTLDSAGIQSYHAGEAPDTRTQAVAAVKGIKMDDLRARQMCVDDFYDFDLLLAMDKSHYHWMRTLAPEGTKDKVKLYLEYAGIANPNEVPDPYYGGAQGFEEVLGLIESATDNLTEAMETLIFFCSKKIHSYGGGGRKHSLYFITNRR